jgi:2-phospho-L-lactate/phosphoenolpyruvate guanylyltransferase
MALVPMKPFAESKGRLAEALTPEARGDLARGLFERTLRVLKRARGITRVAVISRDAEVLKRARQHHAWAMWERRPGLNEALEQATRVARANGMRAVLIVPADLPKLTTKDAERIIELGAAGPCVVIAPAERDEGTNALLVNPAGLIQYAFGAKSFVEHQRRAKQAGARVEVYRAESVALDLDLAEDWKKIQVPNSKSQI